MQMFVNVGGTPCVIFGPGDVKVAHSADEYVPLDEVETCARVLAAWVAPGARRASRSADADRRGAPSQQQPGRDDDDRRADEPEAA